MKKVVTIMSAIALVAGGAVLGIAAENGKEAIEAVLNHDISIMVNGEKLEIYDEATNEVRDPITYNDRTYVPIRFISEALGVAVDWDEATQTVYIGDKPVTAPTEPTAKPKYHNEIDEGTVTKTTGTRRAVEYTENGVVRLDETTMDNIAVYEALLIDGVSMESSDDIVISEADGKYGTQKGVSETVIMHAPNVEVRRSYIANLGTILEAQGYEPYTFYGPGVSVSSVKTDDAAYRKGDMYVLISAPDKDYVPEIADNDYEIIGLSVYKQVKKILD